MTSDLRALLADDPFAGAKALLGSTLVSGELRAVIVETEVYLGEEDPGSHSFRGRTRRNAIMFEDPGFAYVYFNYGMHWMLNVTARPRGAPAAVLIRAAFPIAGLAVIRERRGAVKDTALLSGPGRLTQGFGISDAENGLDLLRGASEGESREDERLRIEQGPTARNVIATKRVGLAVGKGDDLIWRFLDAEHLEWVSVPPRRAQPR